MVMVSVALSPGVTEDGLTEQDKPSPAGRPAQVVKVTEPVKPFEGVTVME